jgi:hypothetical protein
LLYRLPFISNLDVNEEKQEVCQLTDTKTVKKQDSYFIDECMRLLSPEHEAGQSVKLQRVVMTADYLFKYYLEPPTYAAPYIWLTD